LPFIEPGAPLFRHPVFLQAAAGFFEAEIDETAAAVWDISSSELREIQSSLADLR